MRSPACSEEKGANSCHSHREVPSSIERSRKIFASVGVVVKQEAPGHTTSPLATPVFHACATTLVQELL